MSSILKVFVVVLPFVASLAVGAFAQPSTAQVSALKGHDVAVPIDITADRLEVRQKDNMAIFQGNVNAKQDDLRFEADRVAVHYVSDEAATSPTVTRLDATGSVRFYSPSEKARGDWAVYDVTRKLVTIGGDVVLERDDTEIRGDRLEINLVTGVSRFGGESQESGRVKGRFAIPEKKKNDEFQ